MKRRKDLEEEQEKLGVHFWDLGAFDLGVLPTRQASYSSLLIFFQLWEFILWLEFPLMLKNSFSICIYRKITCCMEFCSNLFCLNSFLVKASL